jgi:Domain of Unknown Function (DUF1080)
MVRRWFYSALLGLVFCCIPAAQSADNEPPKGFEALFNGKDLTGWKVNKGGNMAVWGADSGILFVNGRGGGWLMTEKEYADFELRLEYKLPRGGNSGVALRSPMQGDPAYVGMEIQILDDTWYLEKKNYANLRRTQLTGAIYDVVPPAKEVTKPVGEWNRMDITAKGRRITVELNGTKIVDANLDDYKNRADKHPGLLREKGHLGLQSHDGRVEFRNLFVKPL